MTEESFLPSSSSHPLHLSSDSPLNGEGGRGEEGEGEGHLKGIWFQGVAEKVSGGGERKPGERRGTWHVKGGRGAGGEGSFNWGKRAEKRGMSVRGEGVEKGGMRGGEGVGGEGGWAFEDAAKFEQLLQRRESVRRLCVDSILGFFFFFFF